MFRPKDTSLKDRCTLRLQALLIVQQLLLFNNPLPSDYDDFGSWIRLEWWEGKAQVELDPTGPGFDGYKVEPVDRLLFNTVNYIIHHSTLGKPWREFAVADRISKVTEMDNNADRVKVAKYICIPVFTLKALQNFIHEPLNTKRPYDAIRIALPREATKPMRYFASRLIYYRQAKEEFQSVIIFRARRWYSLNVETKYLLEALQLLITVIIYEVSLTDSREYCNWALENLSLKVLPNSYLLNFEDSQKRPLMEFRDFLKNETLLAEEGAKIIHQLDELDRQEAQNTGVGTHCHQKPPAAERRLDRDVNTSSRSLSPNKSAVNGKQLEPNSNQYNKGDTPKPASAQERLQKSAGPRVSEPVTKLPIPLKTTLETVRPRPSRPPYLGSAQDMEKPYKNGLLIEKETADRLAATKSVPQGSAQDSGTKYDRNDDSLHNKPEYRRTGDVRSHVTLESSGKPVQVSVPVTIPSPPPETINEDLCQTFYPALQSMSLPNTDKNPAADLKKPAAQSPEEPPSPMTLVPVKVLQQAPQNNLQLSPVRSSTAERAIQDLINRLRVETVFRSAAHVEHITYYSDRKRGRKLQTKREGWWRKDLIGFGGFGEVWLEKDSKEELRAVKVIRKRGPVNYHRELHAHVIFSEHKHNLWFAQLQCWYEDDMNIYLAMEYFDLEPLYTPAVDIWATGVITYELLTKRVPFTSSGQLSQFCRDYTPEGDELSLHDLEQNGVGDVAVDFIKSLLRPDPEERLSVEQGLEHAWCRAEGDSRG